MTTTTSSSSSSTTDSDDSRLSSPTHHPHPYPTTPRSPISHSYKPLATLSGHVSSVSCLALCGEFILSASLAKDIIVWQQPDLRRFTTFGHGDGSIKSLLTSGTKVFTGHQDNRIRVWKLSSSPSSDSPFRLIDTLPTTKDYLSRFINHSNYVPTRRHHKHLWIQHADSISCLALSNSFIYSASWDKTIKVWRTSDYKCVESIQAHHDAINALIAVNSVLYSASADGKIKIWGKGKPHLLKGILEGHKDISLNTVAITDDGRMVYGGGSDGFVIGWLGSKDRNVWKRVCDVRVHKLAILCMCLMGEFLCTGSADRSVRVWRRGPTNGLVKHVVIEGHEGPVKCLQASPVRIGDGFMLYSGGLDKSIRVWWVPLGDRSSGSDKGKECKFDKSLMVW